MKVLHVIASANPIGGGPIEAVNQLSRAMMRMGHEAEVVSVDAPDEAWLSDSPLRVHALGPGKFGYAYSPRLLPWLLENASRFDNIVVNGLWQYPGVAARRAGLQTRTPYFVYPHGMLDPWFKRTFPLKHLKKSLVWPWADYRVLRDARGVCFTCDEERLLARQSFRRYKCREIVVNFGTAAPPQDAEQQREAFLQRCPDLNGKRLLLFLGRIHPKKGCDLLIEAFARVAAADESLQLVMAGPDQTGWQAQLNARAEALGIAKRVSWPGMLSGDVKWGAFRAADAFVLPSHQENFGISVAEAMACGVPVLISDKVNIWREIQADSAGLIADDTIEGTTNLLQRWLDLPDAERATMRRRAQECFASRFEIERAACSLLEVLGAEKPQP